MKAISIPTIATAIAVIPNWALTQGTSDFDRYGYGPNMMWGGGYGMIFGPLFMILVLALVIATAVLLVRWLGGAPNTTVYGHAPAGRAPLDILKQRFARGEIDKNEYEERRRVLGD